ncbi:MAG: hypothetical protein EOO39_35775 [Cytophagaceae bacterium]|nr:MAG: hypothetical protein EOO39_35775 [Cytophagaceae bacterium]
MKSAVIAAGVAACGLFASAAHAQAFTALYTYFGNTGTEASQAVSAQPTGVNFGAVARGAGVTATGGANSLNSSGWSTTGIDLTDYYGFTITPNTGSTVSLSNLAFTFQRSGTGPTSFAVRSSVDGFATDLYTTTEPAANTTGLSRTIPLTGITGLQNLATATTIRIYGYTATGTAGTFRLTSADATSGTTGRGNSHGTGASRSRHNGRDHTGQTFRDEYFIKLKLFYTKTFSKR